MDQVSAFWKAHDAVRDGVAAVEIDVVSGLLDRISDLSDYKGQIESIEKFPIESGVTLLLNAIDSPEFQERLMIDALKAQKSKDGKAYLLNNRGKEVFFAKFNGPWLWGENYEFYQQMSP